MPVVADFAGAGRKGRGGVEPAGRAGAGQVFYVVNPNFDPGLQALDGRVVNQAINLGVVFFFNLFAAHQLARAPVGGEQEQAFAVLVEPPNGHDAGREIVEFAQLLLVRLAYKLTEVAVRLVDKKVLMGHGLNGRFGRVEGWAKRWCPVPASSRDFLHFHAPVAGVGRGVQRARVAVPNGHDALGGNSGGNQVLFHCGGPLLRQD